MSLRERLKAKSLPTATHRLRISDDADARAVLADAQYALRLAESREENTKKAQAEVDKAQAKVDEHYEVLTLKALPPDEMEALIDAHPSKKQDEPWNEKTFRPALMAACIEGDMTEQDWAEFCSTGPNSLGEVRDLWQAVLRVNDRSPDPAVGKDWERILASL